MRTSPDILPVSSIRRGFRFTRRFLSRYCAEITRRPFEFSRFQRTAPRDSGNKLVREVFPDPSGGEVAERGHVPNPEVAEHPGGRRARADSSLRPGFAPPGRADSPEPVPEPDHDRERAETPPPILGAAEKSSPSRCEKPTDRGELVEPRPGPTPAADLASSRDDRGHPKAGLTTLEAGPRGPIRRPGLRGPTSPGDPDRTAGLTSARNLVRSGSCSTTPLEIDPPPTGLTRPEARVRRPGIPPPGRRRPSVRIRLESGE